MFENKELLNKIFSQNKENQKEYIIFKHSDKTWVMPKDSLKTAFDMYQPSTFKGKLLKKLILLWKSNAKILCKLECEKAKLQIDDKVKAYIEKVAGKKDISIAAYMGDTTSRQNNKATLQVYDKNGLICYVKVTEDKEVAKTFEREIEVLKFLEDKGIANVPKVMGECVIDGMNIFVQSTSKQPGEKVKLEFGRRQLEFIENIVDKTSKELDYNDTDFCKVVQYLKNNIEDFNTSEQNILKTSINYIEKELTEKKLHYAFLHGDYTPWNVYYTEKQLNAFDFEYCYDTMPEYMDIFHYLTQMSFLGRNNETGATVHLYKKYRKLIGEYVRNPDLVYVCYLVWAISFYHNRTEGKITRITDKIEQWISLLDYFNCKIK